jgi:hypothetical protein
MRTKLDMTAEEHQAFAQWYDSDPVRSDASQLRWASAMEGWAACAKLYRERVTYSQGFALNAAAQNDELRARIKELERICVNGSDSNQRQQMRIKELEAENERLRADAARLDWLTAAGDVRIREYHSNQCSPSRAMGGLDMNKPDTSPEALRALAMRCIDEMEVTTTFTMRDTVDALRAVADEKEAQRWQPIETAPKDGTSVLLVNHKGNIAAGLWMDSFTGAGWYLRGGSDPDEFFNGHFGPTHWMPLPKGPKT